MKRRDSASTTFAGGQIAAVIVFLLASVVLGWSHLLGYLIGLVATVTIIYALSMGFKALLTVDAMRHGPIKVTRRELRELDESALPKYTVMVPLYREAEVVGSLITNLQRLDYPPDRLQILLLCEEDDEATLDAVAQADPGPPFEVVVVPPSLPRTKPKVCNLGLARAKGKYVVIYDAEDRPEPDQLKKAAAAFARLSPAVVCLQARLEYHNSDTNLLTRFFASEYGTFFDLLLPSLARLDLPVPLGGTSNHFRTSALRMVGGWDMFNVTEDLDLGMWIARRGWRVEILDSVTWEEANSKVGNWIRQRSRWLKGYMQTYLVHMRSPWRLWRDLGTINFLAFQLFVGATPLTTLLNPALWALTLIYVVTRSPLIEHLYPAPVFYTGLASMVFGNFVFMYYMVTGSMLLGHYRNAKWMILSPAYWLLMSVAGWKAAIQLVMRPHYWEKTTHGLVHEERERLESVVDHVEGWQPRVVAGSLSRSVPVDQGTAAASELHSIPAANQ